MATDPDLAPPPLPIPSPEGNRPNEVKLPPEAAATPTAPTDAPVDKTYWIACLEDAERAERDWRSRGREIVQIYRNETRSSRTGRTSNGPITFNILYANTEVMLPAIYQKPPDPVVRSRFTKVAKPAPPMLPPMMGAAPLPAPGGPPPTVMGTGAPPGARIPPPPPAGLMRPAQKDIETAASVMEKALEIVVDDEASTEATKAAVKDVLLPGRGVCRVRWKPQMQKVPVQAADGTVTMEEQKVWEEVGDEYVYWEDILVDPVRNAADMNWIAFRHLFTKEALEAEFAGSEQYDKLAALGRLGDLFKWTDESAAKSPVGGGSAMRSAGDLGDHIKKAMVWEIWDRINRRIIWFIREATGLVLRVDPDPLQLQGFYPIPIPMLAVTTTDSRIPRPYYDLYAKLAADLDETSDRISKLTKQIKVRGAYNSASNDVADILTAGDGKMIPVDGVDMINGGLANHIWMMPIIEFMNALDKLYLAREQSKQAIYEIMGISDIMRGATKASETATAQRIKGTMGASRLEDARTSAANFARDLLRLKAEIIATNFDAATLSAMTGEDVTPEVMAILRSDFQRTCSIDIETDSTVVIDEQAEQQGMTQVMQSTQAVMQGAQGMLATGILPPAQVIQLSLELLKMVLHPIRFSRGVVEMIDDFQQQLQAMASQPPSPPPMPAAPSQPGAEGPPVEPLPPGGPPMPPPGNGAPPPGLM